LAGLLDALPDGELGSDERAFLDRHAAACPRCAAELEAAGELVRATARLPRPLCPPAVAARVLQLAEQARTGELRPRPVPSPAARLRESARRLAGALGRYLAPGGLLRPVLAAGAAALVAVVLVISQRRPEPPAYSAEQVAEAQAQLQLAFAYLGRMGTETGTMVKQEVVEHMISPTFRVLSPGAGSPEGSR
jgi:anti-sigma factor RsiW